jgi:tetratricopeptide (TPR) repeat protein
MNVENFKEYLQNPSKLYQLNYRELKTLVLEYPYNANLRLLLLQKAAIENDPKFEELLQRAAAYAIDRKKLYAMVQESEHVPAGELQIEKLELPDLAELEMLRLSSFLADAREEKRAIPPPVEPAPTPGGGHLEWELDIPEEPAEAPFPVVAPAAQPSAIPPAPAAEETPVAARPGHHHWRESVDALPAFAALTERPAPVASPPPAAQPGAPPSKKMLAELLEKRKREGLANLADRKTKKARPVAEGVTAIARKSVAEEDAPASETLALLLARQGQYTKAIRMYEKLGLLFPEKSRYFAAAIERIKSKS